MGILRDIMGILLNFTGAKLRVWNYGFCLTITCFFLAIMGIVTKITGILRITQNTGQNVKKRTRFNKI